jgi:cyclic-di-GMP-binding protein
MNQAYRDLREDLPARRAGAPAFPTDARRISAWVDALPRANQAQTQRQLLEAMQAINGMVLSGGQRLALLEQLRPVLLETTGVLARQTLLATFPLSASKALAMDQLIAFEHQLAVGYRLAVVELCASSGRVPLLRGGRVAEAIERALYHQSRSLTHAYALYQAPHAGAWRNLHALFRFAASHSLQDTPVVDAAGPGRLTPSLLYMQALLLALSNPYRFSQKEQMELWDLLRTFAGQVKLHPSRPGEDAFAIPVDSDDGPGYIAEERADDRGDLLWLDLSGLRAVLDLPSIETGSGPVRLPIGRFTVESSAELLRRLRSGWGTASSRHHQRLAAGHRLQSVVGLGGTHFHLADGMDFEAFISQTGLAVQPATRERHDWTRAVAAVPVFAADVLDQSLGGYRVRWPAEQQIKARVGELVGLSIDEHDEGRQWMLGVVRWLRYAGDGSVDGGIELLARRARAIGVRSLDAPAEQRPRMRGIEYEALRSNGDHSGLHLIVPGTIETISGNIEVIRAFDPHGNDDQESLTERCHELRVVENAGDYLVVVVEREDVVA